MTPVDPETVVAAQIGAMMLAGQTNARFQLSSPECTDCLSEVVRPALLIGSPAGRGSRSSYCAWAPISPALHASHRPVHWVSNCSPPRGRNRRAPPWAHP